MDDRLNAFKSILFALSDAAAFLFTKPLGLLILGSALLIAGGARLWTVLSDRRLAARAAGESFGTAAATGTALRELLGMGVKAAGGIRSYEDVKAMVAAGATRIGASAGVQIVKEAKGGTVSGESTKVTAPAGKDKY